ncbi:MAG: arsenic efflux protein [Candidatus Cloacimonetes bacterium]|nr:arsenic efflux protein [Candidatus Cloacimonadota bacterium]
MDILLEIFGHAVMITGFVFVMMLVIEYVNVQTQGSWQIFLQKKRWMQYVFAAFLGIIPGCLGAFTVVALYSHNILSFGALVAAMIATSGDEAFVMLAMFPDKALLLFVITFLVGISAGFISDAVFPNLNFIAKLKHRKLPLHNEKRCDCFAVPAIFKQLQHLTMQRGLLIIIVMMLIGGIGFGAIAPDAQGWVRATLLISSMIALFILFTVPDHFLEEHLWNHIVKVHIPKIFLWTFGSLLVIHFLIASLDIKAWVQANHLVVLLVACIIGLIPDSGPHLIFVTLFAAGSIPFSILLASSIVQDGHGMLPLLAETKRGFIMVKSINLIVGVFLGLLGLWIGF